MKTTREISVISETYKYLPMLSAAIFISAAMVAPVILQNQNHIRTFSLIFSSIVLEAFPMMLLGAAVGGIIESFVSKEHIGRLLPKRYPWLSIFIAAGMGTLFPVCECAIVPVVKRLTGKGLPVGAAVAYLLGGPIVNPVVAMSTALAYRSDYTVVALRLGLGYLIAAGAGLFISRIFMNKSALIVDAYHDERHAGHTSHINIQQSSSGNSNSVPQSIFIAEKMPDLNCTHAGHCCCHDHENTESSVIKKLISSLSHAADDFFSVAHFLVIGAFIAALAQTYIDRKIFLEFSSHLGASSIMMIALAVLLNLCSESDAFIAASFKGLMPPSAQIAFLLTGPMLDLKLLLMYRNLFRKRAIIILSSFILVIIFTISIIIQIITGDHLLL